MAGGWGGGQAEAEVLNDYAALLSRRGRHQQALPVHARALRLKEAALGADGASLATSVSNLALAHAALPGGCREALPLLRRALGLREAALGAGHPLAKATRAWLRRCEAEAVAPGSVPQLGD
jgi:Flp pilus assembly protein TadD